MNMQRLLIILTLSFLSLDFAIADMGTYHQNYDVNSDQSILVLEAGTKYKLKFKGLHRHIDETTLAHKDMPKSVVEIKHDEHKTMGTSTIHVVEVEEDAEPFAGYIHLVTFNGDGGDRVKHKDHHARVIIGADQNCSNKREKVCGVVNFGQEAYKVEFQNKCKLEAAGAKLANEGSCS